MTNTHWTISGSNAALIAGTRVLVVRTDRRGVRVMTKQQAVQTAGERLERIEAWSRRTTILLALVSVLLALIAGAVVYVGVDYLRVKSAMAETAARMQERPPFLKGRP